jgi:nicotinate phosphoribosyltransferase
MSHFDNFRSTALSTDHYEYTMLDALIRSGRHRSKSVFEVFARELPLGRSFGVFAGSGPLIESIEKFFITEQQLNFLESSGIVSPDTARWLSDYHFRGDILSYREGELYFPNSPVVTIEAELGEALILETLILSILNHASAVATAATRIVEAAQGKLVMEAGSRRVSPESAVHAARSAYIGGVDVTSNLEAGYRWGIPTAGTASHAFTLAFPTELEAFKVQQEYLGDESVFLVDTYNMLEGIANAVAATNHRLKGVRLDSGDLDKESRLARTLLDELGAPNAQIMVSGDLDEYQIKQLDGSPIDAFEAGHRLVTGSGAPSAGFVYKLVAVADDPHDRERMRPVAKNSSGKSSTGGKKHAKRVLSSDGIAMEEILTIGEGFFQGTPQQNERYLQAPLYVKGEAVNDCNLESARKHLKKVLEEIPADIRLQRDGLPAIPTRVKSKSELYDA